MGTVSEHTLVALVQDKPGVLNRVASMFRRRAFNISSLTVSHSELPDQSRMTFVVKGDEQVAAWFRRVTRIPTALVFDRRGRPVYRFSHRRGAKQPNSGMDELRRALPRATARPGSAPRVAAPPLKDAAHRMASTAIANSSA